MQGQAATAAAAGASCAVKAVLQPGTGREQQHGGQVDLSAAPPGHQAAAGTASDAANAATNSWGHVQQFLHVELYGKVQQVGACNSKDARAAVLCFRSVMRRAQGLLCTTVDRRCRRGTPFAHTHIT